MKHVIFTILLLTVWTLQAQKKVKLYGFSQGISKGIRISSVDEKGEISTEKKNANKTLLFYLESPAGSTLIITELWIDGEKYKFEAAHIKTPVMMNSGLNMPGQKESILISETGNDVTRIIPFNKIDMTEKDKRKIVSQKPVVVFYTINGKTSKQWLDKMDVLPDLVME